MEHTDAETQAGSETETESEEEHAERTPQDVYAETSVHQDNTRMSYKVDLRIPAEDWPEDGRAAQDRLVRQLVEQHHIENWGRTHFGMDVAVTDVVVWGNTAEVSALVVT